MTRINFLPPALNPSSSPNQIIISNILQIDSILLLLERGERLEHSGLGRRRYGHGASQLCYGYGVVCYLLRLGVRSTQGRLQYEI